MNPIHYHFIAAGFLCAVLTTAGPVVRDWEKSCSPSCPVKVNLMEEHARTAQLQTEQKILLHSLEAKDAIARDLVAGRFTLAEAVTRFQAVNARRPSQMQVSLFEFARSGDSLEERYARSILSLVGSLMRDQPNGKNTVARLSVELDEFVAASRAHRSARHGQ